MSYSSGDTMNHRRRVYLESPFRASTPRERARNREFLLRCMRDSVLKGEAPLASHLLYTQFLDDDVPEERAAGLECGLAWGDAGAEATVVYTNLGVTDGMRLGVDRADLAGRPVEYRELDGWEWPEDAPVGSLRWQLGLLGATLAGAVVAVCPVWWARALWWDLRDRLEAERRSR